jgi:methionyl aminopeptidase
MKDGWTVKTLDGKLSAHYENSVLVTDSDPYILTAREV